MRTFSKLLAVILLLGTLTGCGETDTALPTAAGNMTVLIPKLGSADGAVILTEDATVVIDTGEAGDGAEILSLLKAHGCTAVDLLLISHYDKDHVGGAAELIRGIPVKRVIGSTSPKKSTEVTAYQDALKEAGLQEGILTVDTSLDYGNLNLLVDKPNQASYSQEQSNNSSLVVTVTFGSTKLLFAGDAMAERLSELNLDTYDLIKIPHHGRDADLLPIYLDSFQKNGIAVITSSKKEKESKALISALEKHDIHVYRTRKGALTVTSDGTTLSISQT